MTTSLRVLVSGVCGHAAVGVVTTSLRVLVSGVCGHAAVGVVTISLQVLVSGVCGHAAVGVYSADRHRRQHHRTAQGQCLVIVLLFALHAVPLTSPVHRSPVAALLI